MEYLGRLHFALYFIPLTHKKIFVSEARHVFKIVAANVMRWRALEKACALFYLQF